MNTKLHLDEKILQGHYPDLLREAEKQQLLAQLPRQRRSRSRQLVGKLGLLLLKLGARLKEFDEVDSR